LFIKPYVHPAAIVYHPAAIVNQLNVPLSHHNDCFVAGYITYIAVGLSTEYDLN